MGHVWALDRLKARPDMFLASAVWVGPALLVWVFLILPSKKRLSKRHLPELGHSGYLSGGGKKVGVAAWFCEAGV